MKILAAAAAAVLALSLAGCSSPASSGAATATTAAETKTVVARDVSLTSLEFAMFTLDAAGIDYEVRVQGPEATILKDPKGPADKGKWKVLMLVDDTKGAMSKEILRSGDFVQVLVMPMVRPSPTPTPTPTMPPDRKITYTITADGPILSTTFGNMISGKLSTEQANDVPSPFIKEYTFSQSQFERDFRGFSVTAQAGEGTTTISCQISIDDVEGPMNTSTGPYAVVMCTR